MIKRILILLIAAVPSISAEIEFAGVFYLGGEGSFSLVDSETDQKSGWIEIGQSFQGYEIVSYDREAKTLRIISAEETLDLNLRPSVVQSERIILQGKIRIGEEKEVAIDNALVVLGEEARFQINENTWMRLNVKRVPYGLPPGTVPGIVEGREEAIERALTPRPEGVTGGPLYEYEIAFEETGEDGEPVLLAAPSVTALPGRSFMIGENKYSFTYDP